MDFSEFDNFKLLEKYNVLQKWGKYVTTRYYLDFTVELYGLGKDFIEIWRKTGIDSIFWIERIKNEDILKTYTKDVNIIKELGLDEKE